MTWWTALARGRDPKNKQIRWYLIYCGILGWIALAIRYVYGAIWQ